MWSVRKQLLIQEWLGFPLAEEKHCPMPATARPTHTHSHAGGPAGTKPKRYNPRHPERTLLHQTIAEHFETWHALASAGQFDGQATTPTTADTTTSWPVPAQAGASAPRATPQRCGDGGAAHGSRLSPACGVDSQPPHLSPARGPPLWDDCDAQTDEGVHMESDWDLAAQPAPDFEVDQRING